MVRFLNRHAAPIMAAGVVAGLALPSLAARLHDWIPALVMVILTSALLRLDGALLRAYVRRPALPGLAFAWLLLALPLMVWGATRLLPLPPATALALLLNAVTPPLMGAPAIAMILGLDAELAAIVTFAATLVFPLSLTALLIAGVAPVAVSLGEIVPTVATLVGIPFAVSFALWLVLPRSRLDRCGPTLGATSVAALGIIAVALMHGANVALHTNARAALWPFAASLAFNIAGQGLTALVFRRLGWQRALSLALMAGNRNLALTLGATAALGDTGFAAYVAFAQLPIYLTPMVLGRLIGRPGRL